MSALIEKNTICAIGKVNIGALNACNNPVVEHNNLLDVSTFSWCSCTKLSNSGNRSNDGVSCRSLGTHVSSHIKGISTNGSSFCNLNCCCVSLHQCCSRRNLWIYAICCIKNVAIFLSRDGYCHRFRIDSTCRTKGWSCNATTIIFLLEEAERLVFNVVVD